LTNDLDENPSVCGRLGIDGVDKDLGVPEADGGELVEDCLIDDQKTVRKENREMN